MNFKEKGVGGENEVQEKSPHSYSHIFQFKAARFTHTFAELVIKS